MKEDGRQQAAQAKYQLEKKERTRGSRVVRPSVS